MELGWTGLLIPEAHGGSGAPLLETCIVLEQMGRVPLPGPFFSSAVLATLAARALGADDLLSGPWPPASAAARSPSARWVTATRWGPCAPGPGARAPTGW